MAQYKTGTVNLFPGSAIVSGGGTKWTSAIAQEDYLFMVEGESNVYEVSSFISQGKLSLKQPYSDTDGNNANRKYLIVQDYTTNLRLPQIKKKDWNWPVLLTYALRRIDKGLYKLGKGGAVSGCNYTIFESIPSGTFTTVSGGSYYTPDLSITPKKGKMYLDSYYEDFLIYTGQTVSAAPVDGSASASLIWYAQWNRITTT